MPVTERVVYEKEQVVETGEWKARGQHPFFGMVGAAQCKEGVMH